MTDEEAREKAYDQYTGDDISFDPEPPVAQGLDGSGAWVQAWVWVEADEEGDSQ